MQLRGERRAMLERCGHAPDADVCVILMVQRLAPEKGTMRCLEALAEIGGSSAAKSLDGKRPLHLMIAGDGPSRGDLDKYANR